MGFKKKLTIMLYGAYTVTKTIASSSQIQSQEQIVKQK